ncbi:MAG: pantoate--beta-alanine ligase [Verrucomicrobiota bacterium]
MRIVKTPAAMQRLARIWKQEGVPIGFVPTMGYLHEGHASLMRVARRRMGPAGKVVVSIFVNPTQFGPNEDLSRYPRDLPRDLRICRAEGVDAVFLPSDAVMYPGRESGTYSTYVVEERLSSGMEGGARPTHFRGVTTVVAKLFNSVLPDLAVFGAKDWQQAAVIRRMIADLNFPIRIEVAPTHREPDGLAMSSRNVYLDPEQRAQATVLSRALKECRRRVARRRIPAAQLRSEIGAMISACPAARLDYVEFFDPETLEPVAQVGKGCRMALAVFFGRTRLIDNGAL